MMDRDGVPAARKLGRYILGRRIGSGGMATVYAAKQLGPHGSSRLVAAKQLGDFSDLEPSQRRLAKNELLVAAHAIHPNLARTYEVTEHEGDVLLVMEFIHGASLAACMKKTHERVPLEIVVRIIADAAAGLHALHGLEHAELGVLGVVHRDVSPQNLMVAYDGSVKVVDFGVAKVQRIDGSRTVTVAGKPAYVSPEQLSGARIDRRTDVFSLGVVLHELLTGKRLFLREDVHQTYMAVMTGAIPDPAEQSAVPHEVSAVAMKALARDPSVRFESAEAFRVALLEAAAKNDVTPATNEELSAWVSELLPPEHTPAEIELSITDPEVELAAERETKTEIVTPTPKRKRAAFFAVAGVVLLGSGLVGWRLLGTHEPSHAAGLARSNEAPTMSDTAPPIPPAPVVVPVASVTASSAVVRSAPRHATDAPSAIAVVPLITSTAPTASATPTTSAPANIAARDGTLSVASTTWGTVSIDGVDVGTSPVYRHPLPAGPHTVVIATSAGKQTQQVQITSGEEAKVRFVF